MVLAEKSRAEESAWLCEAISNRCSILQQYTPEHPRNAPIKLKYEATQCCFEQGEDVEYVSREIGYSRVSIYAWRRKYQKYGMIRLMAKKNSMPRQPLSQIDAPLQSDELEALRTQIRELQLEVEVLKETIEVLKKDPGTDLAELMNRDHRLLGEKYALPTLLVYINMARSSYYYQKASLSKPDNICDIVKNQIAFPGKQGSLRI